MRDEDEVARAFAMPESILFSIKKKLSGNRYFIKDPDAVYFVTFINSPDSSIFSGYLKFSAISKDERRYFVTVLTQLFYAKFIA